MALTDFAEFMVIVQVAPAAASHPTQAVKLAPAFGVPVSVTVPPLLKLALHVAPQSMPAGIELTVPPPLLVRETFNANCGVVNVAAMLRAAVMETVQLAPEGAGQLLQPANVLPPLAVAVSTTEVP